VSLNDTWARPPHSNQAMRKLQASLSPVAADAADPIFAVPVEAALDAETRAAGELQRARLASFAFPGHRE
jgi:hypothetical protein